MSEHDTTRRFRRICTVVGGVQMALAASILARGPRESLAPFGVPEQTLSSPHYADAIIWTYTHMLVLGVTIFVMGRALVHARAQRAFARLMLVAHVVYLYLDVRTSDTPLGNGLYEGPASAMPAAIVLVMVGAFAYLALSDARGRAPGKTA